MKKENLINQIIDAFKNQEPINQVSHINALDLHNLYMLIGGMPAVVKKFIESNDMMEVRLLQQAIISNYLNDMSKYSDSVTTVKSRNLYNSLTSQLINTNRKFQYSKIRSGARSSTYELALDWIIKANIINQCFRVSTGLTPLEPLKEIENFKIYFSDIGLFAAKANFNSNLNINTLETNSDFKGAFYENYVACELRQLGLALYYYQIENRAEIDFLIDVNEGVIPIEVKASDNNKSKSLMAFVIRYQPKFSIKVTAKNFGFQNNIYSIPHYAIFTLKDLLK